MRELIGHTRVAAALGERAARGDLAQAFVLSGPHAVGKHTLALAMARTFACESKVAGGCGGCLGCRKIDSGSHPDVVSVARQLERKGTVDEAKNITIEQIREIQQDLALRPLEARRRVVIIDDAADLSEAAEVALLKTLEEPPAHALLLLVTPTPARLLPTVLSRIQPIALRLVPHADIAAGLAARFGKDAAKHADGAGGRPGIAIRMVTSEVERGARAALDQELYGLIGARLTERFAWAADLSDEKDTERRRRTIDLRLAHWSELLRDAVFAAIGAGERAARGDRAAQSAALAASVPSRALVDTLLLLERFHEDLRDNANPRAMLELLALKLPHSAAVKGPTA